jgi:DNA-binding protein Fis
MKSFRKVLDHRQKAGTDRQSDETMNSLPTLRQVEDNAIRQAMKQAKGNQTIAAQLLGITRQTLINKLKKQEELV